MRERNWERLHTTEWDLLIVGGGIAGAGLLREAAHRGLRVAMVEQQDFAWGSSSRSSKLIHGGLRYLRQGQVRMTRTLLRERDRLLAEAPGLVQPLPFLLSVSARRPVDRYLFQYAVTLYELLRNRFPRWDWQDVPALAERWPDMDQSQVLGAWRYPDARTDDARMVWRLVKSGMERGGVAVPYVRAESLLRERGHIRGARVRDELTGTTADIGARVVVNATGVWGDQLRGELALPPRYRPLRGSHIVVSAERAPSTEAAAFRHPRDRRYLYAVPWEGTTLIGVTDLDHDHDLAEEPRADESEIAYLLEGANSWLAKRPLTEADITSTFAGVRPVVGTDRANTYMERRDSVVWREHGLITVTAGKLTSFQVIVLETLRRTGLDRGQRRAHAAFTSPDLAALTDSCPEHALRLAARFGAAAADVIAAVPSDDMTPMGETVVLWAEVRWAARHEYVTHLDDLLLRRTRVGQLLRDGGASLLPRVRTICSEELGWSAERWEWERDRYLAKWRHAHASGNFEAALAREA